MKKWFLLLTILSLVACSAFVACGDDDDTTTDDASGDDDDDSDDTGGLDDTADDDADDVADDDIDDDVTDDDASAGCEEDSGLAVTLCNPVYSGSLTFVEDAFGWPIEMLSVTYDGAIQAGYQLALDCSSYRPSEIYPWVIPLTIYVGGADTGVINAQGFIIPDRQTGPFYEDQSYSCPLFVADAEGITVSNEVSINVTLGPKS
jgi:hypothetical protein